MSGKSANAPIGHGRKKFLRARHLEKGAAREAAAQKQDEILTQREAELNRGKARKGCKR